MAAMLKNIDQLDRLHLLLMILNLVLTTVSLLSKICNLLINPVLGRLCGGYPMHPHLHGWLVTSVFDRCTRTSMCLAQVQLSVGSRGYLTPPTAFATLLR
ncbi:hypothetical protein BsWGS_01727 [Bradybaena similaris]